MQYPYLAWFGLARITSSKPEPCRIVFVARDIVAVERKDTDALGSVFWQLVTDEAEIRSALADAVLDMSKIVPQTPSKN